MPTFNLETRKFTMHAKPTEKGSTLHICRDKKTVALIYKEFNSIDPKSQLSMQNCRYIYEPVDQTTDFFRNVFMRRTAFNTSLKTQIELEQFLLLKIPDLKNLDSFPRQPREISTSPVRIQIDKSGIVVQTFSGCRWQRTAILEYKYNKIQRKFIWGIKYYNPKHARTLAAYSRAYSVKQLEKCLKETMSIKKLPDNLKEILEARETAARLVQDQNNNHT